MRLQRLEIAGFKSFPDRAQLAFDAGVTAIVGPNGCGKSNVVDAISWVLGEQSAKSLRGDRMEDVIFSGSDARKPTGAAEVRLILKGVATVTSRVSVPSPRHAQEGASGSEAAALLPEFMPAEPHSSVGLLDPSEGDLDSDNAVDEVLRDVEVARRLYRSGESEYLIDGEVCRLRDVQDLLMDSGLGTKAYAVIEQGKIGQILSAKPTDRRQLIEEAAGVTKYKSRRRSAELKLEAAQGNLTRIDDIIFEVEKQRGALKRQAAKARRYRRLREELRRSEKVLFAGKYRALSQAIESSRARLDDARARESAAAARLAEREGVLERLRIELTEADSRATTAREEAHARELEIGRGQQQLEFDRQQVTLLSTAAAEMAAEIEQLDARREPARLELEARRRATAEADRDRDRAASALDEENAAYARAHGEIDGLEADVEAARNDVFAALNAATALRHAVEHAAAAQTRLGEQLSKLEVEAAELRRDAETATADRGAADAALQRGQEALAGLRVARVTRESELAAARVEGDWRAREMRSREQAVAGTAARLRSLEELEAARAAYGEAARLVLSGAVDGASIAHMGSVADYVEVDRRHERAAEACLGDLLEHVVVATRADAEAGLSGVRDQGAGRCGFLIVDGGGVTVRLKPDTTGTTPGATKMSPDAAAPPLPGLVPLRGVVRCSGPAADAIVAAIPEAWVAETLEQAARAARVTAAPVATLAGQVCRGPHVLQGGARGDSRGILASKNEIRELRERLADDRAAVESLAEEIRGFDGVIAHAETAIAAFHAEQHRQEKLILGYEHRLAHAVEETEKIARKLELVTTERRHAEEERRTLEARQMEAAESIVRLETEQQAVDGRFTVAQRCLCEAREAIEAVGRRATEARAAHAALVERSAALAADAGRLEQAAAELEARIAARRDERHRTTGRRDGLVAAIAEAEQVLDREIREFEAAREAVRDAEEQSSERRTLFDAQEVSIREARRDVDTRRARLAELDIERATAQSDLTHLASACEDAVQATLDEVAAEVAALEASGDLASGPPGLEPSERDEDGDDDDQREEGGALQAAGAGAAAGHAVTTEEVIAALKAKIDRLGPVNMMAIEQFDELETRHAFLTAQRKDLVDAIAATGEAIKRIDRTTRERFKEAFTAINQYFSEMFVTLFGGGRAGLVLLDENDLLETGVDIIAQPPGKRLQNVMLLSGGEKALTAMSLMFGIFKYRPSPFCLLDEIDAPLDDANIGRFVEMLRGMQDHTQFILITHNRKTMEIADRLYGVTMEEPGVSKLISLQLN